MKNLIILFSLALLKSCIVPSSPKRDYYKLLENNDNTFFYDGIGYVYKNDKDVLNLWVFSTPWKSIYFSTNIPIKDSIKVLKNNKKSIYLKRLDGQSINELPYKLYHNDSVQVYTEEIKIADKDWYKIKNGIYSDTLKVEINNKYYEFYFEKP